LFNCFHPNIRYKYWDYSKYYRKKSSVVPRQKDRPTLFLKSVNFIKLIKLILKSPILAMSLICIVCLLLPWVENCSSLVDKFRHRFVNTIYLSKDSNNWDWGTICINILNNCCVFNGVCTSKFQSWRQVMKTCRIQMKTWSRVTFVCWDSIQRIGSQNFLTVGVWLEKFSRFTCWFMNFHLQVIITSVSVASRYNDFILKM
jgi:hypothetical protein